MRWYYSLELILTLVESVGVFVGVSVCPDVSWLPPEFSPLNLAEIHSKHRIFHHNNRILVSLVTKM